MTDGAPAPRSYIARHGRLTPGQRRALETLGPLYVVAPPERPRTLDARILFGHAGPLLVEIGSGNGAFLTATARAHPEGLHLGIEVYPPGLGHTLLECARDGLGNVRLARADAAVVLDTWLADRSVESLVALFPDPWPKKRHRKRRLLTRPEVTAHAARVLAPGGLFVLVTDAPDYAEEVRARLAERGWSEGTADNGLLARVRETPFARRALARGAALASLAARPPAGSSRGKRGA